MSDFRDDAKLDPSQVEDMRGASGPGFRFPGGIGGGAGGGIGVIVAIVLVLVYGTNVFGGGGLSNLDQQTTRRTPNGSAGDISACRTGADANAREDCRIVGYVNSIQKYWSGELVGDYTLAKTRFFTGEIDTGCGVATSDVGPFYCPADKYV